MTAELKPKETFEIRTSKLAVSAATAEALHSYSTLPSTLEFLGGERILKKKVENKLDVHSLIRTGFPTAALQFLVKNVPELSNPEILQKTIGMSLRTLQRKKSAESLLTSEQSGKVWDFAAIVTKATDVFGSQEDGLAWLMAPAIALNDQRPIDLISTTAGRETVQDLLTRLDFGVYA